MKSAVEIRALAQLVRTEYLTSKRDTDPIAETLDDCADLITRLRHWAVNSGPTCTEEQLSALLRSSLAIPKDYADVAATTALKAIQDCRDEVTLILDGKEIPE